MPLDIPNHWSRKRIISVLQNLEIFRSGIIPEYRQTGYTTPEHVWHGVRALANWIPATEMAAEATLRVGRAGADGDLVMVIYADGWEAHKIARLLRCEERDIWGRVSRALRYASDDDCLIEKYSDWRKRRRR